MVRFLSREEWPLVAGGIIAGLLTFVLVLYLFVRGIGGSDPVVELVTDTLRVLPSDDIETRRTPGVPERVGPVVGAREAGIRSRLARFPVYARPLRGPITITARNVVWNEDGGARFARADVVSGQLDVAAAQRGDIVLEDVVLREPVVALRERGGGWNFEDVFEELLGSPNGNGNGGPTPRAGRRRVFRLGGVRIVNGTVDVTRPGQEFGFRSVDGTLPVVVFSEPGLAAPYLRVGAIEAEYVQPEPEPARVALSAENGLFYFPSGTVRFDIANAAVEDTRFADLSGTWDPADPGYGITATGVALGVDFADIAFLLPEQLPRTGTATFAFEVQPAAPDHNDVTLTELDARSGESRLLGTLTMRLGDEFFELLAADLRVDPVALELIEGFTGPLPYDGLLTGTVTGAGRDISFDLIATLTAENMTTPFDAGIVGQIRYTDTGIVLRSAEVDLDRVPLAALRAIAPGLPVAGTVTGTIALTGMPDRAPLDLNVRLELGAGVALVEGQLDLTGAVPSYDVSGQLLGVDLQAVLQPDVPPVSLTAGFVAQGSGFDPATMNAELRLAGRFTGWESTPQDTITLVAAVYGGTLAVDTLYGSLATADVQASGAWHFIAPQTGAVDYAIDVTSLRPFGPWIPVLGDSIATGAVTSVGTLSGTLERIRIAGGASGGTLQVGEWRASEFAGEYDLTFGGERLPVAVVNAEARDITTPTAGNYTVGTIALRMTPPDLDLQVNATRTDGGVVDVAATGFLPENGLREVRVQRARFDLADDRWVLLRPATFRWTEGEPVYVDDLEIRADSSGGRVAVDGVVLPLADMDARIAVAAFPVGDIQRLLARPVRLDGMLWAEGAIRGGGSNPLVDVDFRIENGAVDGVALQQFAGTLAYADGQTTLDAQVVVDTAGRLDIDARIPSVLRLGGTPFFELIDGEPMSGSIVADDFALAPLLATVPQVRDVSGYADANVTLAGTPDNPEVAGTFILASGSFRVPSVNQVFTEASADVGFDGRRLVLNDVRVRSEGWATIGGQIVLERLDEPVFDLTIAFDAFEPIGVDDHPDAAVWGEVTLTGGLDALLLTGAVEVADGYVAVPDLGRPSFAPELVEMTRPASFDTLVFDPDGGNAGILENLRIRDLVIDVSTDTWFDAYQAQVQLAGMLTVNKTGNTYSIVGTLAGNRGQYTLIAGPIVRRFEIVSAEVRFRGEPRPNPAIDITARRIVLDESGRQLDVDVRITGTAESPTLQLAGNQQGQIPESELLSFLLFGTASSTLGGEQLPGDLLLGQTTIGSVWEVFALELERSLGGAFDIFQLRLGQGTFGFESPTIVLGKQILPDVFLTLETALNGLFGEDGTDATTWTMRLDWNFDRRTRLRLALEPVYRGRGLRSSAFALPVSDPRQQLLIELRRRWTY